MKKPHKWRNLALVVLASLIAFQVGVSALARTRSVHGYLEAHLERAFGRPVQVAHFDVRILPAPRLDAAGVTVGEDPEFGYEYFLRAEQLSASLRWTGLLQGHFEFGTLSLTRPSLILVRNAAGRWNLERWLPPAKPNPAATARVYGPPPPAPPANHLQTIQIDEGRINFKNGADKAPFAFTSVSGSVEQISPGRWRLRIEAQPWRSGVALQSTGTLQVRGDLAGTSARLQPAEFSVHWDQVSLADLFRLLRGEDYGVRGVFMLDAAAKSGPPAETISTNTHDVAQLPAASPVVGEWTFSLQAQAAKVHRWDLTERSDNPSIKISCKGSWNPTAGTLRAEDMSIEAPKSNLRGAADLSGGTSPGMELRVDSAGIQASDLLAWYRAFYPDVAEGVDAEQYFTGALKLRGWPLKLEEAAFSSRGGMLKLPGQPEPVRIGAVLGGTQQSKLVIDPVRVSFPGKPGVTSTPAKSNLPAQKRSAPSEPQNTADIAFTNDFETHEGAVSINGRVENLENLLKMTATLGRQINHGWELTGAADAALRWEWKDNAFQGLWNGHVDITKAQLVVAGLNQPLRFDEAAMEWKNGKRTAHIAKAGGFGANWSGEIAQTIAPSGEAATNWHFQLRADHLNAAELDRWVGPRARPNWLQRLLTSLLGGASQSPPASELLRRISAEGELRADEVTVEKLKLENVRALMTAHDFALQVSDATAQWAGGKVQAKLRAAFSPRPRYEINADVEGVSFAQLSATVRVAQRFGGSASGKVHLTTEGVGREELLQKLAGQGAVHLKNIEFRGWDVAASMADGAPRIGASLWTAGEGSFTLNDRTINIDDLRLDAGKDQTLVNGTVSFARDADLTMEAARTGKRLTAVAEAQHVLRITGPLDGPRVSVAVASAPARQPAD